MTRLKEVLLTAAAVIALLWGAAALLRTRHGTRNFEFLPDMVVSPANESFSPSALLPGGMTQQGLVEGVVPRGVVPFDFGPGPEEAERAGVELSNPFGLHEGATSPEDLERGRRQYGIYCAVCHDERGEGRGKAVERGMLPPPSLLADRALTLPDGTLFHILTRGQGNMATYEAQLSADDRWRIVRWIRALQGGGR